MRGGLAGLVVYATLSACHAPAAAQTFRLRGIAIALDGSTLYLKANDGGQHELSVDGARVFAMVPATLADVKPDSYVGIVSVPEKDARRAIAINIFPAGARGSNEGEVPWDTAPDSLMTNATVTSEVGAISGQTLKLKYKGQAAEIMVTPQTQVVTMTQSDLREISPGVHLLAFTMKQPDGRLKAEAIIAGQGGLVPPI